MNSPVTFRSGALAARSSPASVSARRVGLGTTRFAFGFSVLGRGPAAEGSVGK
jgi:hypothetical protein